MKKWCKPLLFFAFKDLTKYSMSSPLELDDIEKLPINEGIRILSEFASFPDTNFEVTFEDTIDDPAAAGNLTRTKFYCNKITIPSMSLTLERHQAHKKHFLKSVEYPGEVTIDWYEDQDLSVWRWHNNWLKSWFNSASNTFRTGKGDKTTCGKKKNARIVFYKQSLDANYKPIEVAIHYFYLLNLVPTKNYDFSGNWQGASSNVASIKYKVDRILYHVDSLNSAHYNNLFYQGNGGSIAAAGKKGTVS